MDFPEALNPISIVLIDSSCTKHVVFASDHKRTQFARELCLKRHLEKKAYKVARNIAQ